MNIEIANRLADLRKQHGLSQEELADKLGVSRQAVSKWECGESSPDTDNLIALADIYGISLDELLGKTKEAEVIEPEIVTPGEPIDNKEEYRRKRKGFRAAIAAVSSSGFLLALIAFLLMGFFWKGPTGNLGWAVGWTAFLLPIIIVSLLTAFEKGRVAIFSYPIFIVFVYCGMGIIGGAYGLNLWHPYWFLFITIPIFYMVAGALDRKDRE